MSYIFPLLLLIQASGAQFGESSAEEIRFNACIDATLEDPGKGLAEAQLWVDENGDYFALHCLGFGYTLTGQWPLAQTAFERAATAANAANDSREASLWTQAGNAALAGGQPQMALGHFNIAIAKGTLEKTLLGEVHLDKARALVALDQPQAAKAEFAKVHQLVPQDPLGWLLSATLARRMDDLARAQADIDVAATLAPRDPEVGLEAGNIAAMAGRYDVARRNWEQAIAIKPDGPVANTARRQLADLNAFEGIEPAPPETQPRTLPAGR